jgi:hypothetical protein
VVGSIPGNPIFFCHSLHFAARVFIWLGEVRSALFATRYILHGTVPWRVFLFGWARCAQRAFSSVLGALAVFVSFICSFISFEIHWRYFFSIARACSAALTTLGVLHPFKTHCS